MDAVHGPYLGYIWPLIGGHLALDLVNTVAWQLNPDRRTDRLVDPAHVADWLAVAAPRHQHRSRVTAKDLSGSVGEEILTDVRAVRDAARALLSAHVDGGGLPPRELQHIRRRYYRALGDASVDPQLPLVHKVEARTPGDIATMLGLAVGDLCSSADLDRLRRCADSDCGWLFLDTSRNQSRRWCDAADCGNRNRVRAFAARARA